MTIAESTDLFSRMKAARRLPSPPGTALRVLSLCRQCDVDVGEVAAAIMSDPALSGRLLKYANSSIAGVGRDVTSVRDAVLLLGLRSVKLTALGFSIATPDLQPHCPGFDMPRFWAESFATALLARRIAARQTGIDREEAFTASLLVGIGRLAFAHGCPDDYGKVLREARAGKPLLEVERERLGLDHLAFGEQLLADWGLPDVLVEAVGQQVVLFDPEAKRPQASPLARVMCQSVQLMPLFVRPDGMSEEDREKARSIIGDELKIDEESWRKIAEEIAGEYREMAELFDFQIEEVTEVFDLYAEAQEEATRVGMVAQLERTKALEENRELLKKATTDGLTGIANRVKFEERMKEAMAGMKRGHGQFALIMFDIDHFKKFNDTYGHDVGDLVLKQVAQTVQNTLREEDLVARYGGEEFIIIAPYTDQRGACIVAARIRKCVESLRIPIKDQTLQVTISVGLSLTTDYKEPPTAEKIVSDADKQLYLSKHAGRNTWSYLNRTASQFARSHG